MCPALLKCRAHFKTATANWAAPLGQAGTDYNSAIESSVLFTAATPMPSFQCWDLTSLTRQWVNGATNNYGVILLADNENQIAHDLRFHSADSTPNSVNQPVLEVVWTQQQRSVYYLKDHLGSVRASVDDNGQLMSRDDYDPWGLQLAGRSMTAQPNLPNKFTGKERDTDFGLNWDYFGARFYGAEIGKWLVIDPALNNRGQRFLISNGLLGVSPYTYTFNRPTVLTDPDGECPQCVGAVIGAVVEYGLQVAQTGSFVPTGAGLVRIGISALAGAGSAGLSTASEIGAVAKVLGSGAINATAGAAKNTVSGNQVTPGSVVGDFGIGLISSGAGLLGQTAAQASSTGKALAKTAKRLTNIANTGGPRVAQTARAAIAQANAQTYGAGPVASAANGLAAGVVGEVVNPGQPIPPSAVTNPTVTQAGVANSDKTRTVIHKIVK